MPGLPASLDHYQYLLVMAACLIGTLPLELVLGVRVWRRPARLARAVAPTALAFSVWDIAAIRGGWWTYSSRYTSGLQVGFGLPLEELAFFICIPVCGVLSLEAVRVRLGRR